MLKGATREKERRVERTDRSKLEITSLNSHFPHQKPQHRMLRSKKAEPRTPYLFGLNQDIVAWSQKEKCGVCNVKLSEG